MTDLKNRDLELKEKIQETFTKNRGRYGVRRITMTLRNAGTLVNHKKVQRLMHAMGLLGKRPKEKYHSYKGETGKIADNIIARDFHADEPLHRL